MEITPHFVMIREKIEVLSEEHQTIRENKITQMFQSDIE